MKISFRSILLALAAALVPSAVQAQVCLGRPSHEAGNIQLGGGYSGAQGVSQFGVSAAGLSRVAFGQASLGSISYDDFDGSTLVIGASGGYRLPIGSSGNAELCPVVGGFLGMGPNDIEGSGVDASLRGANVGVSLGYRLSSGADVAVIPTFSAGFAYSSFKLTDGTDSLEDSDTYGIVGMGVGLVLGRQVTALPSVSIPLGLEDSDPVLGITFILSLGRRP